MGGLNLLPSEFIKRLLVWHDYWNSKCNLLFFGAAQEAKKTNPLNTLF
jgi:hypothetical protein